MPLVYGKLVGRPLPGWRASSARSLSVQTRCLPRPWPAVVKPLPALRQIARRSYADTKLDLVALDRKWRQKWESVRPSSTPSRSPNGGGGGDGGGTGETKYILPMFPYPSGYLHLGHLRVYTIADVLARFHQLQGHDVMLPMGWDAFGLPAENAAIERGIDPAKWTRANIERMKEQLRLMNGSWDWSRELSTCDPSFYKHTQKIFLMLHGKGLAYQDEAEVNFDPVDNTVLANEQVDANGCSWRSGAKVEKRRLRQWFLRISAFREALLQDLEVLAKDDAWPERVLAMQKNWLGKSQGALVKFPVLAFNQEASAAIEVFTTRPDTLFGVQYVALAATHPIAVKMAQVDPELRAFLDTLPGFPPDSKVGYLLPRLRAINPLAYHEETPEAARASLPVYVAPYVLGDYGEGAVMGVPGHDLRDNAFWKEHHYDEPVRVVLAASEDESTTAMRNEPFTEHGFMTEHSGPFRGKASQEAGRVLVTMLEAADLAKPVDKWRLRDWLISRQRYWGAPIPIIHCDSCGAVPVPDDQLPVPLPEVDGHWAERKAGNPLAAAEDWVNTPCPACGSAARRDTDTMDTFVDSSWYYMRFTDPHNDEVPFAAEKATSQLPVDLYIGGVEHAILHLLYARFIYKFLMTSSLASGGEGAAAATSQAVHEPFKRLITQGMVHGKTYSDPATGRFLRPDQVDLTNPSQPRVVATGEPPTISFEKMSKSKHNGVDPTEFIAKYGADATRAHMLFQAPVPDVLNWDEEKISGVTRWLARLHGIALRVREYPGESAGGQSARRYLEACAAQLELGGLGAAQLAQWDADSAIWRELQQTIASVTASYRDVYSLNTVVSDLMGLTNTLAAHAEAANHTIQKEALSALLRMLAPVAPAFAEECWSVLFPGTGGSMFTSARFPAPDGSLPVLKPRLQSCAVQVNGKLRHVAQIPNPPGHLDGDGLRDWVVAELKRDEEAARKIFDGPADVAAAKKVVVVRGGKLVNFVL